MIWGLAGRKRAGKNTAGDFLAEHGFIQVSLAAPIRDLLEIMDPIVSTDVGYDRLGDLLDEFGSFEGIKSGDEIAHGEIRRLMQRAGTEWGRSIMHGCIWLMALEDHLDRNIKGWWRDDGPRVVITDIRFNNEARWVHLNRGKVINIERPSVVSNDNHVSEAGLDPALVDYHVLNIGTLHELRAQLTDIYSKEQNSHVALT